MAAQVHVEVAQKDAQLAARRSRRQRQARNRLIRRLVVLLVVVVAVAAFVVGEVYAGSSNTLPAGQTISGVDVGDKSTQEATQLLEQKALALASTPVPVRVAGHTFRFRQADLGVSVDWA